jgi:hypothetical protein
MTWTAPKTWTAEPLTSADLNAQVRDNLLYLKEPPTASVAVAGVSVSGTSTAYVAISASLKVSVTTTGGDVLVVYTGRHGTTSGGIYLNTYLNGTDPHSGANWDLYGQATYSAMIPVVRLFEGLAPGVHEFQPYVKATGGGSYSLSGTWTLWAKEIG